MNDKKVPLVSASEIDEKVKKLLNLDEQRFFVWLCAVRSLPFLCVERNFGYWKNTQIHLQSIFYALDVAHYPHAYNIASIAAIAVSDAMKVSSSTARAADLAIESACGSNLEAIRATRNAADAARASIDAIRIASLVFTNTIDSIEAASYTVYMVIHAVTYAAAALSIHPKELVWEFQDIIFNDIEMISSGNYNKLYNDTSVYGSLWDRFQNDLAAMGCQYWADLYVSVFNNHFQFDEENLQILKQRINVPIEVRQKGARLVANYLETIGMQGSVLCSEKHD